MEDAWDLLDDDQNHEDLAELESLLYAKIHHKSFQDSDGCFNSINTAVTEPVSSFDVTFARVSGKSIMGTNGDLVSHVEDTIDSFVGTNSKADISHDVSRGSPLKSAPRKRTSVQADKTNCSPTTSTRPRPLGKSHKKSRNSEHTKRAVSTGESRASAAIPARSADGPQVSLSRSGHVTCDVTLESSSDDGDCVVLAEACGSQRQRTPGGATVTRRSLSRNIDVLTVDDVEDDDSDIDWLETLTSSSRNTPKQRQPTRSACTTGGTRRNRGVITVEDEQTSSEKQTEKMHESKRKLTATSRGGTAKRRVRNSSDLSSDQWSLSSASDLEDQMAVSTEQSSQLDINISCDTAGWTSTASAKLARKHHRRTSLDGEETTQLEVVPVSGVDDGGGGGGECVDSVASAFVQRLRGLISSTDEDDTPAVEGNTSAEVDVARRRRRRVHEALSRLPDPRAWSTEQIRYYRHQVQRHTERSLQAACARLPDQGWQVNWTSTNRRSSSRYYCSPGGGGTLCRRCDSVHAPHRCPLPVVCHLCGVAGHGGAGVRPNCPEMVCYACGGVGHTERRCRRVRAAATCLDTGERGVVVCSLCRVVGQHSSQQCPDLWRRYHCTTPSTAVASVAAAAVDATSGRALPVVAPPLGHRDVRPAAEAYCYHCGGGGHFGHECGGGRLATAASLSQQVLAYDDVLASASLSVQRTSRPPPSGTSVVVDKCTRKALSSRALGHVERRSGARLLCQHLCDRRWVVSAVGSAARARGAIRHVRASVGLPRASDSGASGGGRRERIVGEEEGVKKSKNARLPQAEIRAAGSKHSTAKVNKKKNMKHKAAVNGEDVPNEQISKRMRRKIQRAKKHRNVEKLRNSSQ